MAVASRDLSRFMMTYGLLLSLGLGIALFAYRPLQDHISATQQSTGFIAKNRILGYQTPDFKRLAFNIFNGHLFTPGELDKDRIDAHYLPYLPFYEKASALFPELFEMHYFKGICYLWMGNSEQAEVSLEKAMQINPVFFWTYYNLALLYLKEGQVVPAMKLLAYAKDLPMGLTEKTIYDLQAFRIIWMYMPNPGEYIHNHLLEIYQQLNHPRSIDYQQWRPIFF